jgi:hypothetical protein
MTATSQNSGSYTFKNTFAPSGAGHQLEYEKRKLEAAKALLEKAAGELQGTKSEVKGDVNKLINDLAFEIGGAEEVLDLNY